MFERFTARAGRTMALWVEEAARSGVGYLGTEHLLVALSHAELGGPLQQVLMAAGLSHECTSAAVARLTTVERPLFEEADAEALQALGIDLQKVLDRVHQVFGPQALRAPRPPSGTVRRFRTGRRREPSAPLDFSAPARQVLLTAPHEAMSLNDSQISPEHMLLALLRQEDGAAVRVLTNLQLDLLVLRKKMVHALKQAN